MALRLPEWARISMWAKCFPGILPKKTKKSKVPVREARKILKQQEADKLIDMDEVTATAIERAEQDGIIFLDEIDKIAGKDHGQRPGYFPGRRAERYSAHCRREHGGHEIWPGKDRLYAVYRGGGVPCFQNFGSNSGTSGKIPHPRGAKPPHQGGFCKDPFPDGKRDYQAVYGAFEYGRHQPDSRTTRWRRLPNTPRRQTRRWKILAHGGCIPLWRICWRISPLTREMCSRRWT